MNDENVTLALLAVMAVAAIALLAAAIVLLWAVLTMVNA